jgi:hypothetical protein
MARPTNLTDEVLAKAKDYLSSYRDEYGHAVPSVVGLCRAIDRARSTVYLWAEDSEGEFSDILEGIKEIQEAVLIDGGLKGNFNSTITKLMLTKHDYSDKVDSTHGGNGTPIETITRVERVIVRPEDTNR